MESLNEYGPGLVMGTAGHIDHGKTMLIRALTGEDLDRLREEKKRGITIELGFVALDLGDGRRVGVVDVPGHEKFIKTMVAGAQGIDFVLLVVAADEGVMPQTREHLDICVILGVKRGLVALTKSDKVDSETLELATEDVKDAVTGTFLEGAPVIHCSAVTGKGIDELRNAIKSVADELTPRSGDGIFRMPVDRSFSVKGFGTVVTGTVISGIVNKGDEIQVLPGGEKGSVRELESHGAKLKSAVAGHRLAVNISGIDRREVGRGRWIGAAGRFELARTVDTLVSVLPDIKAPLEHAHETGLHVGTAFIIAELDLLGAKELAPGEEGAVRLHLREPLPLAAGDRFVLRSFARKLTVAGGEVVDPFPGERALHRGRKGKRAAVDFIPQISRASTRETARQLIETAGLKGVGRSRLLLRVGDFPSRVEEVVGKLVEEGEIINCGGRGELLISKNNFVSLREMLYEALAGYHGSHPMETGPSRASFKSAHAARISREVFDAALNALTRSGRVAAAGDKLRTSAHSPEALDADKEVLAELETVLKSAGKTPPTFSEIADRVGRNKKTVAMLLKYMVESGRAEKISEDLYFHPEAVVEIKSSLREHLKKHEGIDPVEFKKLFGVSRKYAIPLLEYLDRERFTMRVGNRRVLREKS